MRRAALACTASSWAALSWAALSLAGCDTRADADATADAGVTRNDFRVDCLGMYVVNDQGGTLVPLLGDDATISEEAVFASGAVDATERCRFWITPPLREGPLVIKNDAQSISADGSGSLFIRYGGARWVMRSGDMVLGPSPFPQRTTGWYDGLFAGPGGETARIHGLLEWCEPSLEDCPYKIDAEFGAPFQVRTAVGDAWGEANACRALIDRASGGLQVDLQVGSWRGVNVGQLWSRSCGQALRGEINKNHMVFRAGGVDGPGRYGPFRTTDFEGTLLPHLEWTLPATFWFHDWGQQWSFALLCSELNNHGGFRTQADGFGVFGDSTGGPSICEFEIEEDPGTFKLSCSRVVPAYDGNAGRQRTRQAVGELHLTAACDVRYTE